MFPKRGITELMDENDFFLWDVLGVSGVRFPLTCLDVAFVRRSKKVPGTGAGTKPEGSTQVAALRRRPGRFSKERRRS
jgi:hypothetical protein